MKCMKLSPMAAEAEQTGYSYTWRWTQRVANSLGLDVLYFMSRQHSMEAGRLRTE